MKVLMMLDSLVPGGTERSTVALLPYLIKRGVEVEMATLHDRPGLQDEVAAADVPLHVLADGGGRIGWVRRTHELIGDRRPDLVHTSLFEADLCGRIAAGGRRVPVVSSLASESYGSAHLGDPDLAMIKVRSSQALDAITARLTRRLHAVSNHVAEAMARNLRYPRNRIDVVYRGRSVALADADPSFNPITLRAELGVDERARVVLAVARHEQPKGLDRLIEAFPAVQDAVEDAVLVIAGRDGHHTPVLHRAVEQADIASSVFFLGDRSDVGHLLRLCDTFVLPSRREGMPGALIEAMAAGAPAVATDLPQIREVVPDGEALLADCEQPDRLAAAIVASLTDGAAAGERVARAEKRFRCSFTLDQSADGMVEFYERALGS